MDNHSTGAAITWWLRIRFEMSTSPCRPAVKVVLWYPCERLYCRRDLLKRFDVGNSPHGRVSWWATHAPAGGELLDAWLHAHRARYAGFILARGHLDDPWLERIAALAQARESPGGGKEGVATLRAAILVALRQRDALICHDDPFVGTFERRVEPDGSVRHYDRQGRLECPTTRPLIAGEPLTCLSFSANMWEAAVDPFPQHLMFFANVANATAKAPMYQGWAHDRTTASWSSFPMRSRSARVTPSRGSTTRAARTTWFSMRKLSPRESPRSRFRWTTSLERRVRPSLRNSTSQANTSIIASPTVALA